MKMSEEFVASKSGRVSSNDSFHIWKCILDDNSEYTIIQRIKDIEE